jgi:hypothetical protein
MRERAHQFSLVIPLLAFLLNPCESYTRHAQIACLLLNALYLFGQHIKQLKGHPSLTSTSLFLRAIFPRSRQLHEDKNEATDIFHSVHERKLSMNNYICDTSDSKNFQNMMGHPNHHVLKSDQSTRAPLVQGRWFHLKRRKETDSATMELLAGLEARPSHPLSPCRGEVTTTSSCYLWSVWSSWAFWLPFRRRQPQTVISMGTCSQTHSFHVTLPIAD